MGSLHAVHLGLCAASAVCWPAAAGWRIRGGAGSAVLRALAGGAAAFGLALCAYALLEAGGVAVAWERVLAGGWPAVRLAALIGLVEEGAKLCGIALALGGAGRRGVMRATVGVSAAFAALEAAIAPAAGGAGLARALLAPVAHALLAAPLGFALAAPRGSSRRRALPLGLATAAALHAAGDLALSVPGYGRLGYAAALLAPGLWAYLHARRSGASPALTPPAARGA